MKGFSINIRGRIKNFNLPKNQPLIPLFEAIVNSIHAIEERHNKGSIGFQGQITIKIVREDQVVLEETNTIAPIESFEIVDNGSGFDDTNFNSFLESDSTYKASFGGKGVGRFSWLIAFEKATIESIYKVNSGYVKRNFEFSKNQLEVDETVEDCTAPSDNVTTIKLLNCVRPYCDNLPKLGSTIAMRIIQHCLIYFMAENCPQIHLIDEENYNLNAIFKEKIKTEENQLLLNIAGEEFELLHVKAEDASVNGNKLFLCAHNRLVATKELEKCITDLDREIYDKSKFWYVGVLRGKYLDDSVDMNRLSFNITETGGAELSINTITMNQIVDGVVVEVKKFLEEYLAPIGQHKAQRIRKYVMYQAPQFRHLLKYMAKEIAEIKPNLSDDKLDDELHRLKRHFDKHMNEQSKKLLSDLNEGVISADEYKTRFSSQIEKINCANGATLAEYVSHRRVILDLLEYAIHKKDDGKFQKESFLHDLIYPMRTTSEETNYSNHNLWLIDERLAYCSYISSDIPFNNDPKQERTDVMILDCPIAVSDKENDGTEYDTIILFELKRPMRNDYNDSYNPVTQLYNYVSFLRSGKAKDRNGRTIRVSSTTKFYLYAVCDITNSLERIIEFNDFTETPDKMGYYKYNDKFNAYMEILPYDKIINDAKKRNRILFDKLGI